MVNNDTRLYGGRGGELPRGGPTGRRHCLSGMELSREEFQDNLLLRYGILPLNLPIDCDGCGKMLLMLHAFIVPGARWDLLPPGTLTRCAYTAT